MSEKSGQPDQWAASSPRKLARELDRKVGRARLVILLERLWPAMWAPIGVAGVFLLLSIFGFWSYLGYEIHRGLLWAFGAAMVVSLFPLIRVRWPSRDEGLRRLEETAGLPHRPATSYHDTLSGEIPSQATHRVWLAHRKRLAELFALLRAGWPHPRIDRWDPYALRSLLVLLLAVGFVAQGNNAETRIQAAFDLKPGVSTTASRIDAWITPPVYTGEAPMMIADGARQSVGDEEPETYFKVPQSSELTVRVNDEDVSRFTLRLLAPGQDAQEPSTLEPNAEDGTAEDDGMLITASLAEGSVSTAQFKEELSESTVIELREDETPVARWTIDIIPDTPPSIAMTEEPSEAQRGSLKFQYGVEDDYGVLSARARFALAEGAWNDDKNRPANVERLGEAPDFPLTLPRANTKKGEGQTFRDLTGHFWAGLPVTVTLEARDQAGQLGFSEPVVIELPERRFSRPLAKALIEQRKKLVDRPDRKDTIAVALDALTIAPEKFIQDQQVYLGIRSAYWRLKNNSDRPSLKSAANLLWDIAVDIEDGDLSDAERRLRMAQEELMQALENGASDEEIQRLMDELRTALNEFMQEMARQAQQNPNFDPNQQQMSPDRMLSMQDLERMMQQIEDLARTGSRDAARQMLSQLREMMENLQAGRQAPNGQAQQMMQNLDELSELIQKQQQLLDETFRQQQQGQNGQQQPGQQGQQGQFGQQGQRGQQPGQRGQGQQGQGQQGQGQGQQGQNPFAGLQGQQGDLQRQLQDLMKQLQDLGAQAPNQLEGADRSMGEAGNALGDENAGQATEQQTLALDQLRQGAQSLAEQMMNQMGQQPGQMGRAFRGNGNRDPLGRPLPRQGLDQGDSVKVPEESDVQRARQILEELRQRLGERGRPPAELDYIERLIERF